MPIKKKVSTVAELDSFISVARPGDAAVYHSGLLCSDRIYDKSVSVLAQRALDLADQFVVALVQKRRGESYYDYIAVRGHDIKAKAA